jgi:hypothetical protein
VTLEQQFAKRRDEIVEFFSWRFGIRGWAKRVASETGLSLFACQVRTTPMWFEPRLRGDTKRRLGPGSLLRLEHVALQLGFRPDRSERPVNRNLSWVRFSECYQAQHKPQHKVPVLHVMDVDAQGVGETGVLKSDFGDREPIALRPSRRNGRAVRFAPPAQLELGL